MSIKRRLALLASIAMLSGVLLGVRAQARPVAADGRSSLGESQQARASSASDGQVTMLQEFWSSLYPQRQVQGELPTTVLGRELLAKASPDECFNGVGVPYSGTVPTCELGQPKVNQAYVWGLAKSGDDLWFGTGPNVHCLVLGGYLGITMPIQTESYVCEFGESQYSPPLPAIAGDWRLPDLFRYSMESRVLQEISPPDARLPATLGIRSAGALGNVTLLGGPALPAGINLFAFNTETGDYLGSTTLLEYANIRKWLVVDGVLYTGVRDSATGRGRVLRWRGDLEEPFEFEVVGDLSSEAAELALHDGRLFVTTWPNLTGAPPAVSGLWMSPPIPPEGLTSSHASGWELVWQASDYEPDPVTAATYGGGALHSFGDYLYWGTMHVPFVSAFAHFQVYGPPATSAEALTTILGTHRAINVFRGRGFGSASQEVELLYGSYRLPVYVPTVGLWLPLVNTMEAEPLWGEAGLGNLYNNYTWTMAVYRNRLYVGTMDYGYLLVEGIPLILQYLGLPPGTPVVLPESEPGADLFRFPDTASPALPESLNGVGNVSTYGVRTMLSDDALYLGMANPMNLLTDPASGKSVGGWELLRLSQKVVYLPIIRR